MAEDEPERQARDWLHSVDPPLSGLDVGEIVQVGRARTRQRRLLAAGVTATAVVAAVAVPIASQAWLGTTGADPAAPPEHLPVLECTAESDEDRKLREVVLSRLAADRVVLRVDRAGGYVLGTYDEEPGSSRYGSGWMLRGGQVVDLVPPEGYTVAQLVAASHTGDVVGTVMGAEDNQAVALWPAADPDRPRVLALPAAQASAAGITDDGAIFANRGGPQPSAYRWDATGAGRPLPMPEGVEDVWVSAVNGGFAVGNAGVRITRSSVEPIPGDSVVADLALPGEPEIDPPGDAQIEVPVRWDLKAGTVEILDPLGLVRYGVTSSAEAVTATGTTVIAVGDTHLVYDGQLRSLAASPRMYRATAADATDGTTVLGGWAGASPGGPLLVWRC